MDGRAGGRLLEPRESLVDAGPAGRDELHEERQVVDASVALGEQVALETLQPADHLVQEAPDLRDVAADREHLGAHAVLYRVADASRQRCLELGRRLREAFELLARAVERRLQIGRTRAARGPLGDALSRAFESEFVHRGQGYSPRRMKSDVLDYELPRELIAQRPTRRRDESRLLVYRRRTGEVAHCHVAQLPELLDRELVVVNDTRVVPARLRLRRESGAAVEVLLVERVGADGVWEGLARPSRRLRPGERLGPVELLEPLGAGRWRLRLEGEPAGEPPLPPYIHERLLDAERYQTVYADEAGSAAAPTAGLHLTPELLARLDVERVTLHVGLDTFKPLTAVTLEAHELHGERYSVRPEAWARIREAERVLAVGTTTVRTLETLARGAPLEGRTSLYVTPGFEFRRVNALLTNFHLPRSTLLALVMAFAGVEETKELYRAAIAERYRFYSFGDAMLVL